MAQLGSKAALKESLRGRLRRGWPLYFFLLPGIIACITFQYLPMFSNYIAFLDYNFNNGWFGLASPFAGFKNFETFITNPSFWPLVSRTVIYSLCLLLFSFPVSLVFALCLNELRSEGYKRIVQTLSYVPHFVSWVTVAGLFYMFLSTDRSGLINNLLELFGFQRHPYMQNANNFLPFLIVSEVWKELGWGTIIYLASLTGIDPQLYEAAMVDGATRWQRCLHITLPSLMPTTSVLLIFALGRMFSNNFDQIFNMQNPLIRAKTDTLNIHIYYRGVVNQQYAYSAAVGLFTGVVSLILVVLTNALTTKISETGVF
ncbi:MAG: ABC transporter permease subunit [Christensenellaceae bacterium]|jgi:putative aldouronate transport system permease protein|nr:ABC transporter permease subunit [Christensenellaceae bacterium]